ncbi:amidohydrolase [Prauserella marina]|uniref:Imidazolonepropionase n=1 Tax=Prauserella marina TaxID=530584 RepID=A0A222VMR7_9PSEU|nr:amidohydrolase family protein [Prauserella marina]ASR35218.1 amidohydrolase [Prauserella marina]PWV85014.1 imidazolonepropionase-like amidohydrolase [Prauserella marina]SDC06828.1 Imidazolonepropionase [Prauserella marina]
MNGLDRRRFLAWLGTGALGAAAAFSARGEALADSGATALTNVNLIDGTGAAPRRGMTVVVGGGRILAVGRPSAVPDIAGLRVIDCTGKHLLPGLWDLHAHESVLERTFPPLHLVHGVTAIREMSATPATHLVRERIERGELAGPRMVIASRVVDGPSSRVADSVRVATPAEAREAVALAKRENADLLKVYSFFEKEGFRAVASEAARQGLPFGGHTPSLLPVQRVLELGQHSVEHMYGLHLATSAESARYYERIAALPGDPADENWWGSVVPFLERESIDSYRAANTRALAGRFRAHEAWHVPTLAVEHRYSTPPALLPEDPGLRALAERFLPRSVRQAWEELAKAWPPWSPERTELEARYFEAKLELVGDLAGAEGNIGAGTDCGYGYVFPGLALHDELELLVRAGLPAHRALLAATRDAARCAGLGAESGTIEPGKLADLLVLDADPLADIRNTRCIHAVVARGEVLGPRARQRLFAAIEQAAREEVAAPVMRACCSRV